MNSNRAMYNQEVDLTYLRYTPWMPFSFLNNNFGYLQDNQNDTLSRYVPTIPLTLARKRCFATFAGVGGGWCDPPPWRFQTKRRRASRKRPADCSRRVLAIGGIIFGPRSIFDPVMAGQRSNFRKFHDFSTSRVDGIKTIYRSGMKPSPACSPFNSA